MSLQAFVIRPSADIEMGRPMQGEPSPIAVRAAEQFAVFEIRLKAAGRSVVPIDIPPGSGGAVGDLAVLTRGGAVLMRPTDVRERHAVAAVEAALRKAGLPIAGRIEAPGLLDGGDVLVAGDRAFIGVPREHLSLQGVPRRARGNDHGRKQFAALAAGMGYATSEVAVSADVERLRSVAAFAGGSMVSGDLVDTAGFGSVPIVRLPRGEDYAAGLLPTGPHRVIANVRFRETPAVLRRAGLTIDAIDLWEFGKIGFTPSLLALLND